MIRGGSWIEPAVVCTSAFRFYSNPHLGNGVQGFRIASVPSQKEAVTACGNTVGGWRMRDGKCSGIKLSRGRGF